MPAFIRWERNYASIRGKRISFPILAISWDGKKSNVDEY
jgi:hypothetical protein